MKKYRFLKGLALILVAVMLFSCLPLTAVAGTINNSTETETEQSQSQNNYNDMIEVPLEESTEDIYILAEDTSKRGEFEKHYLCSDGRFVAVTYPEAVHYQDESGEWSDIDNSLSLNSAKGVYEAENGDFKISFHAPVQSSDASVASASGAETTAISGGTVTIEPVQTQPESLITLTKGEQTLSWTLTAIKSPSASGSMTAGMMNTEQSTSTLSVDSALTLNVMGEMKSDTQTVTEFIKKNVKDPDAFALPKISNQVQYDSLFGADEGISVRYTTYRNKIKEDIIISKETDIESFSMLVNCSGLTPVLNTDGSVDLLDGDGEMVYHVGAPYMYDAAYSICDVEVTLVTKGDICIITYTPDSEWMSSPDREYPIVLDPSVSTSEYTTNVYDTYVGPSVTSSMAEATGLQLYSGQIALIGFRNLPVIHSSMPIYEAELNVNLEYSQFTEVVLYLEMFQYSTSVNDMLYADYTSDEANDTKSIITTAYAAVGDPSVEFDVSADIYNIYAKQNTTVFAIRLTENYATLFCYPIASAEHSSVEGPSLVVYYGYRLPDGLANNDLIVLQNAYDDKYLGPYDEDIIDGHMIVTKDESRKTMSDVFFLSMNEDTGAYSLRTAITMDNRYVTVQENAEDHATGYGAIISTSNAPDMQEWYIVGAGVNTFYLVLRSDMSKYLTVVSYGYQDVELIWHQSETKVEVSPHRNYLTQTYMYGEENQQWKLYKVDPYGENEDELISNDISVIETGTYYINNVAYGGFLSNQATLQAVIRTGLVSSISGNIKWQITNIGNNEYTFQLYDLPNYYMYCTTNNDIKFAQKGSTLSDDCIWQIETSVENAMFFNIKNKATGRYLVYNGTKAVTDTAATDLVNHRWRIVDVDEYVEVTASNVSFPNVNVTLNSSSNLIISLLDEVGFASLRYDFDYVVITGSENIIFDGVGNIQGINNGVASIRATHKTTGVMFTISVVVCDTYFLNNKASGSYLQAMPTNTGNVAYNTFTGDVLQMWDFIDAGDGYYKIQNRNNYLYLTSPISTAEGVKINMSPWLHANEDCLLWKFTELDNGAYKIQAKIHESTSLCLMLISTNEQGVNAYQISYTDDSDYRDEWFLVPTIKKIDGVPTSLRSGGDHLCIPCAITNVAGYWSNNGYFGFGCLTERMQILKAKEVQSKMIERHGEKGHEANNNIPTGTSIFSHTDTDGYTHKITPTVLWKGYFDIDDIIIEIFEGRPLLLGFGYEVIGENENGDEIRYYPYGRGHMTVCAGYEFVDGVCYVYVSDARADGYVRHELNLNSYNDFICQIKVEKQFDGEILSVQLGGEVA